MRGATFTAFALVPSGCWFPSCIYKQPLSLSSPALWLLQPHYELFMTLQALELETCELCFAAVQSLEAPLNVTTASSKSFTCRVATRLLMRDPSFGTIDDPPHPRIG